jgi:threonylcarbamoyladenosine tRNA methylthiotransferase MtaB
MHIFGFSPREGTKAARLPGRIEGPVIRERSRRMHQLAARMKEARMREFLGSQRTVLWEGGSRAEDGQMCFQGYTDNYLRVQTCVPAEKDLQRTLSPALLCDLAGTPGDRFEARLV